MPRNLEDDIVRFVEAWGPDRAHKALRHTFLIKLREIMNAYAEAAIRHGNIPEVDTPHGERGRELDAREDFMDLAQACDFLKHYHQEHTEDMVTRFRGKADQPDIYIVGDSEWKAKTRDFLAPIFPEHPHRSGSHFRRRHPTSAREREQPQPVENSEKSANTKGTDDAA